MISGSPGLRPSTVAESIVKVPEEHGQRLRVACVLLSRFAVLEEREADSTTITRARDSESAAASHDSRERSHPEIFRTDNKLASASEPPGILLRSTPSVRRSPRSFGLPAGRGRRGPVLIACSHWFMFPFDYVTDWASAACEWIVHNGDARRSREAVAIATVAVPEISSGVRVR